MAIIYPRETPGRAFQSVDFKLLEIAVSNTLQNGAVQTMDLGDPLWTATFRTPVLLAQDRQTWQAWAMSLRRGRKFLAFDPEKEFPAAYRATVLNMTRAIGGAFDGSATLGAVTATTVQVLGLPALYQARAGDMLSFPWNGVRALHQVVEDAAANSSGIATLSVEPPVRLNPAPAASATVDLVKPACVMLLKPGTFSAPASYDPQPVSFEAVQAIV
ncbi:hypothetical protein V5F34_08420 [Xanthobacter autotrophicus]|uniref:hypothetical protein n=1 Tax=Xanthobacter autotrophicus TaxID=280 RepID=UPI00372A1BA3